MRISSIDFFRILKKSLVMNYIIYTASNLLGVYGVKKTE